VRSRTSFALFSIALLLAACSGPVATQLPVIPSLPVRSQEASSAPSAEPSAEATKTPKPTEAASVEPSTEPSEEPSVEPSQEPSVEPSQEPSVEPSQAPVTMPPPAAVCGPIETLSTKTPGRLTLSTDNPAFLPWWGGDPATQYPNEPAGGDPWENGDPYSMEGYEGATAYAIANQMGFTPDLIDWVPNTVFAQAFAPGPKQFDFHMAQISIRPKRALNVDFSDPYFDANQAVLAMTPNAITGALNINDLKGYKLGAAANTTSFDLIEQIIQPTVDPTVYPDNNVALQALKNGQIDGLVVDLSTAFYMRDAQLEDFDTPDPEATIVGQFSSDLQADPVGAVLQKDSPLTPCVNQAIAAIKADGELQTIYDQWISTDQDVPLLQ
jgi:polar amino acid transport system substrate-binding protein